MASASKRQTTFAKLQREQAVREKRARKQSERLARRQAKRDAESGIDTSGIESDEIVDAESGDSGRGGDEPDVTESLAVPPAAAER
jgi:hypothetical protein